MKVIEIEKPKHSFIKGTIIGLCIGACIMVPYETYHTKTESHNIAKEVIESPQTSNHFIHSGAERRKIQGGLSPSELSELSTIISGSDNIIHK